MLGGVAILELYTVQEGTGLTCLTILALLYAITLLRPSRRVLVESPTAGIVGYQHFTPALMRLL